MQRSTSVSYIHPYLAHWLLRIICEAFWLYDKSANRKHNCLCLWKSLLEDYICCVVGDSTPNWRDHAA